MAARVTTDPVGFSNAPSKIIHAMNIWRTRIQAGWKNAGILKTAPIIKTTLATRPTKSFGVRKASALG